MDILSAVLISAGLTVSDQIVSTRPSVDGAPFSIVSDIMNPNLNADRVDGYHATALLDRGNHTGFQGISTITGLQASLDSSVSKNTVFVSDLNAIPSTGFFYGDNTALNSPTVFPGVIEIKRADMRRGQIAVDTYGTTGRLFVRSQGLGNVWSSWNEAVTTGNQATLTRGSGLLGGNYTPMSATSWSVDFGTGALQVAAGNHTHTFASLTSKPSDLLGYGITNAYTKTENDSLLSGKENSFSKGDIVAGTNITLSGTLTGRLVGAGSITINSTASGGVSGSGTLNYMPLFTASSVLGNSNIWQETGYVNTSENFRVGYSGGSRYFHAFESGTTFAAWTMTTSAGTKGYQFIYDNTNDELNIATLTSGPASVMRFHPNKSVTFYATTGISPINVTSTTRVANFNADFVDGYHASDLFNRVNHTGAQAISTVSGLQTSLDSKIGGGGTPGKFPKFATANTLGDSIMTEGSGEVRVNGYVSAYGLDSNAPAGSGAAIGFSFSNGTSTRWSLGKYGNETGANAGSDMYFSRYDDAGAFIGNSFMLSRATGVITLYSSIIGVAPTADAHLTTKYYVDNALYYGTIGKENSFSKGDLVAGTGVTLSGTLTNRLVGAGNVTITASASGSWQDSLNINNVASSMPIISRGSATTSLDYIQFKPTDYGTGKPYLAISKSFTANKWEWYCYDGVSTTGNLNFALNLTRFDVNLVDENRSISAGTGLSGGGTLAANRTLSVAFGSGAGSVAEGNDSRINNGQTAFTSLSSKEDSFSKGSFVAGTNVTLSGTLTNRLVGSGNITINASGGGGGTVTSVGLTVPTGFTVTSSPITTSGNISFGYLAGYELLNSTDKNTWNNYASQISSKLDSSAYITINGVSGTLSTNPSFTVSGGISGGGTSNYLPIWTSGSAVGNSMIRQTTFSVLTAVIEGGLYVNGGGTSFYQRTETQKNAMSASVGDMIYQTNATEGLWMYKSTGWVFVG